MWTLDSDSPEATDLNTFIDPSVGRIESAAAITEDGNWVAGLLILRGSGFPRAFMLNLQTRELTELGTLGGDGSSAGFGKSIALSPTGPVVVGAAEGTDGESRAFVWRDGLMEELPGGLGASSVAVGDMVDSPNGGPTVWIAGHTLDDSGSATPVRWKQELNVFARELLRVLKGHDFGLASGIELQGGTVGLSQKGFFPTGVLWRGAELFKLDDISDIPVDCSVRIATAIDSWSNIVGNYQCSVGGGPRDKGFHARRVTRSLPR